MTKSGRMRTVEVVEPLAEDLAMLRPKVDHEGRAGRPRHQRPGALPSQLDRRVWRPAGRPAGFLDAVPYDGRHTFASLLINEGRAVAYVSAALGHSSYR